MIRYMLDTDTASYLIRGDHPEVTAAFREKFGAAPDALFYKTPANEAPHMPWLTVYGHKGAPAEAYARQIGAQFVCLHRDKDRDGKCDFCALQIDVPDEPDEPDVPAGNVCNYCRWVHPDTVIGRITRIFHSIAYFFAHLFGRM